MLMLQQRLDGGELEPDRHEILRLSVVQRRTTLGL
jgi:hypothetical protein